MAIKTIQQLKDEANVIKTANTEGANTQERIGTLHLDTVETLNSKIVQADWSQTNAAQPDFIRNKPTSFTPSAHNHPQADWAQDNAAQPDFIKNKPLVGTVIDLSDIPINQFLNTPSYWENELANGKSVFQLKCSDTKSAILIMTKAEQKVSQLIFGGLSIITFPGTFPNENNHKLLSEDSFPSPMRVIFRTQDDNNEWGIWKYLFDGAETPYEKISELETLIALIEGGGITEIPQATDTTLGGIKANAAQTKGYSADITQAGFLTVPIPHAAGNSLGLVRAKPRTKNDTQEVAVDEATGKLYYSETEIPEIPEIPVISNHTITTKQGGIVKGQFTLNQNDSAEINLDWVDLTGTDFDYDYPWDIASDEENTMKIALIQELLQVLRDAGFETNEFNPCTIRVLHSNGCSSTMIIKIDYDEGNVTQWFYGQFRIGQTNVVLYSDISKPYALYRRSGGIADFFGAWEQVNIIKSVVEVPSATSTSSVKLLEVHIDGDLVIREDGNPFYPNKAYMVTWSQGTQGGEFEADHCLHFGDNNVITKRGLFYGRYNGDISSYIVHYYLEERGNLRIESEDGRVENIRITEIG